MSASSHSLKRARVNTGVGVKCARVEESVILLGRRIEPGKRGWLDWRVAGPGSELCG